MSILHICKAALAPIRSWKSESHPGCAPGTMADAHGTLVSLRASVKAWEAAFVEKRGRRPDALDIRADNAAHAMYVAYAQAKLSAKQRGTTPGSRQAAPTRPVDDVPPAIKGSPLRDGHTAKRRRPRAATSDTSSSEDEAAPGADTDDVVVVLPKPNLSRRRGVRPQPGLHSARRAATGRRFGVVPSAAPRVSESTGRGLPQGTHTHTRTQQQQRRHGAAAMASPAPTAGPRAELPQRSPLTDVDGSSPSPSVHVPQLTGGPLAAQPMRKKQRVGRAPRTADAVLVPSLHALQRSRAAPGAQPATAARRSKFAPRRPATSTRSLGPGSGTHNRDVTSHGGGGGTDDDGAAMDTVMASIGLGDVDGDAVRHLVGVETTDRVAAQLTQELSMSFAQLREQATDDATHAAAAHPSAGPSSRDAVGTADEAGQHSGLLRHCYVGSARTSWLTACVPCVIQMAVGTASASTMTMVWVTLLQPSCQRSLSWPLPSPRLPPFGTPSRRAHISPSSHPCHPILLLLPLPPSLEQAAVVAWCTGQSQGHSKRARQFRAAQPAPQEVEEQEEAGLGCGAKAGAAGGMGGTQEAEATSGCGRHLADEAGCVGQNRRCCHRSCTKRRRRW